jgi:stage V sporulation protein R
MMCGGLQHLSAFESSASASGSTSGAPNQPPSRRITSTDLPIHLEDLRIQIEAQAREYGLSFDPVIYQMVRFDVMNQLAAYGGFPLRYPHWRWGMEFEKLSKRDAYGMGRIYEMVINTNPVYAYLQESNSVTDQKLVMAHVFGHADFFKNNLYFARTNRKMLDEMANHATRVRRHIDEQGLDRVEKFLDACLSAEWLIDAHAHLVGTPGDFDHTTPSNAQADRLPSKAYLDKFINPPEILKQQADAAAKLRAASQGRTPARATKDVLLYILRHAKLESWQQDLLTIVRDEALYFAPQAMTKIMNEGWASFWHSHLMTRHFASSSEIICYCQQHSGVMAMPPGSFNPYKIGIELWRDIERRWNTGQHSPKFERLTAEGGGRLGEAAAYDDGFMMGREKIFEIRKIYNDVSFIDEFFTESFCQQHQFFVSKRDEESGESRITSRDFAKVKKTLLHHLTNRGEPIVYVADGNYLNRGELYLAHAYDGLEMDGQRAERVLRHVRTLWGRPVHLQMVYRDEMHLLTCTDPEAEVSKTPIRDDTPAPAHQSLG